MLIGGNENQNARKHVVVLGGESKLKPKRQIRNDSSNKRPKPYNHCMIYTCIHIICVIEDGFEILDITNYDFCL